MAMSMARHAVEAGLVTMEAFEQHYDDRTTNAVDKLLNSLPALAQNELNELLEEAAADAAQRWEELRGGRQQTQASRANGGPPAGGLVADAGTEDVEHPD